MAGFGDLEIGVGILPWLVCESFMLFGCYFVVLVEFGWFFWMVIQLISRLLVRSCVMLSWLDIGFV